jgi:hypothetical protein
MSGLQLPQGVRADTRLAKVVFITVTAETKPRMSWRRLRLWDSATTPTASRVERALISHCAVVIPPRNGDRDPHCLKESGMPMLSAATRSYEVSEPRVRRQSERIFKCGFKCGTRRSQRQVTQKERCGVDRSWRRGSSALSQDIQPIAASCPNGAPSGVSYHAFRRRVGRYECQPRVAGLASE